MDGTKHYQLYVQLEGRWEWICDIQASSHSVAFRKAMLCLKPEHYDKPIRLEQAAPPAEGAAAKKAKKKPAAKKQPVATRARAKRATPS